MTVRSIVRPIVRPIVRQVVGGLANASTDAVVVVMLGQSLNVSRGTQVLDASWNKAYMPVDDVAISDFTFSGVNVLHTPNWASLASAVVLSEGTGQSPAVGIAMALQSGASTYGRAYLCSAAIGARALDVLNQGGPRGTLNGIIHRLCDLARADGYTPYVVFYSAHGEADAAAATSEATYYQRGLDYYGMAQLYAQQAMGDPTYVAPVLLTYPEQQSADENDRNIKEAIRRIADDLAGSVDCGPIYQWPSETDLVHPTPTAYVLRGEWIGRQILDPQAAVSITGVVLDGDEFTASFSEAITRDDSIGVGTALAGTDGFEWIDDGTPITINSLVYGATTVTGTLASTPAGAIGDQVLRYAMQLNTPSAVVPDNLAGGYVRAASGSYVSAHDASTQHRWAIPQRCSVSAA